MIISDPPLATAVFRFKRLVTLDAWRGVCRSAPIRQLATRDLFDQAGPAERGAIRQRPGCPAAPPCHIGLATATYLYRGAFQHRDSLGSNQMMLSGAVNWMVSGRGVENDWRHGGRRHGLFDLPPDDRGEFSPRSA